MNVRVKLFAVAKQAAGADFVDLEVPEPTTVAAIRDSLVTALPDLAPARKHLLFAINAEYAADAKLVKPNDEVACIPPVSGG